MRYQTLFVALLAAGLFAVVTLGEVPNQTPEQLNNRSTHIVVGKVKHVYTSETETETTVRTAGIVEVLVSKIEKGDNLREGQVVYGRYWRLRWKPGVPVPPGSSGHAGIPKEGERIRMHVKQVEDGGYDILLPNGVTSVR